MSSDTDPNRTRRARQIAGGGVTREPSAASVDERRTVFVTDEPRMPPLSRRHINSWLVEHEGYTFERITEDGRVFQRLLVVDKCPTCKQSTRMIAGPWRDLWGDLP